MPPTAERVRSLFAGRAWMPHAAAHGPRMAACLRRGAFADGLRRLAATPCSGWAEELLARVAALMLLGPDLRCARGPAAAFDAVVLRRRMKLPAVPD